MTTNLIPATVQATVNRTMRTLANPQALAVALGAWRYRIECMSIASRKTRAPLIEALASIEARLATEGVCVECGGHGDEEYEEDCFCPRNGHRTVTRIGRCHTCKGEGVRPVTMWERRVHLAEKRHDGPFLDGLSRLFWDAQEISGLEENSTR